MTLLTSTENYMQWVVLTHKWRQRKFKKKCCFISPKSW